VEGGEVFISQGDPSDAAYFLHEGSVGVFTQTAYGPVALATLNAPRLIGEIGVLTDLPRTASIKALSTSVLYRIDRELLRRIGRQNPTLLLSIITQLGRQMDAVNKAIGLYTNALSAFEKREFDERILEDLRNPPAQLAEFSATFLRFANQISVKRRQQEEMASGAVIQQSLLPKTDLLVQIEDKVDIWAAMRPARDVGGDFYDYFMLDADRIAFSIGDVCGKGLPASLFMAVVVTVLRTSGRDGGELANAMARANATLCRDNAASMFATAFFGVLNVRTGVLDYCNCGHVAPILVAAGFEPATFPTTGIPLGLFEERPPKMAQTKIRPGDTLILFTDGVTEAMNAAGEEFGETRLLDIATTSAKNGAAKTVQALFSAVDDFAEGVEQSDDITCLVVSTKKEQ
jgi:serine phosphatase RsbU (regulator of sigma subunit)